MLHNPRLSQGPDGEENVHWQTVGDTERPRAPPWRPRELHTQWVHMVCHPPEEGAHHIVELRRADCAPPPLEEAVERVMAPRETRPVVADRYRGVPLRDLQCGQRVPVCHPRAGVIPDHRVQLTV